jgi:glycosyl transferase family 25
MIPVYVVSLRTSHDRRGFVQQRLEPLGVPFRFFDAVDGRKMTDNELLKAAPKGGIHYGGMLTFREIGCALSHLAVLREIAEGKHDHAAVIEDDFYLLPEARKFLDERYLRALPPFDILQLGGPPPGRRLLFAVAALDGHRVYAPTKFHNSMFALIYNRDAARKIADTILQVTAPIDNMLFKDLLVPNLRVLAVLPSAVVDSQLPSVIGERPPLKNPFKKAVREMRRFYNWCRRWRCFAQAWGLRGVFALRLRYVRPR